MISPAYILHVNNDIVPGCLYRRPFSPGWSSQQQAFPKILLVPSIHPFHRLIPGPSSSNSFPSYSVHASLLIFLLRLVISQLGEEDAYPPHESLTLDIFASENSFPFLKPSQFLHQPRNTRVHPCLQCQHFSLSARRNFSAVLTIPFRPSFSVNRHLSTFLW